MTSFVRQRMQRFNLPPVPAPIPHGELRVLPLTGADHAAQFVAYAASVRKDQSDPAAIERIGLELGRATRENGSIQVIHCPLLGAGAGGLQSESVVARLSRGFQDASEDGSLLKIFVLHIELYEQLVHHSAAGARPSADAALVPSPGLPQDQRRLTSGRIPPRVLISYTGSSPGNQQWVDDLFRFLREYGVNARLDTYFLRPGMDVVQWMCNELDLADRVILVCGPQFRRRLKIRASLTPTCLQNRPHPAFTHCDADSIAQSPKVAQSADSVATNAAPMDYAPAHRMSGLAHAVGALHAHRVHVRAPFGSVPNGTQSGGLSRPLRPVRRPWQL